MPIKNVNGDAVYRQPRKGGVDLFHYPHVGGTHAKNLGLVSLSMFVPDEASREGRFLRWCKAETELYKSLKDRTRTLGGNAVVGCEISLDPFAVDAASGSIGLSLCAVGTATVLESRYSF